MAAFTNRATISWGNTIRDSNVVTGEIVEVLSMTKNASRISYLPGDTVTYIISIRNSGSTAFTGLTVTDDLGAYTVGDPAVTVVPLTYVDGSVQLYVNGDLISPPTVTDTDPLTVTGISVPAASNVLLIYEAVVNAYAPADLTGTILNTASVTGGGLTAALTDTAQITAAAEASLTISKSLCPETVTENGQITYTFVIQNSGNTEVVATDDAIVTDIFNPILSDLTVTYNGTVWAEGTNYTYDETTGTFTTLPGQITVPAAAYTQNPETGVFTIQPGVSVITVTGTV